jgi:hypothetical protein
MEKHAENRCRPPWRVELDAEARLLAGRRVCNSDLEARRRALLDAAGRVDSEEGCLAWGKTLATWERDWRRQDDSFVCEAIERAECLPPGRVYLFEPHRCSAFCRCHGDSEKKCGQRPATGTGRESLFQSKGEENANNKTSAGQPRET